MKRKKVINMVRCEECGQEIPYRNDYPTIEEYELCIKKDIPEDVLCHTCTYICIFHEERHYKCSDYNKKDRERGVLCG